MASKKKIEQVAAKSVDDMSKAVLELQQKARESLSAIDGAFVEKQQELRDTLEAIKAKQDELNELYGKEKIGQEMQQLEEELEDRKHQHERAIAKLDLEAQDAHGDQIRDHLARERTFTDNLDKLERERKIRIEDEDRDRDIRFKEWTDTMNKRQQTLSDLSEELGSFDERVKQAEGKAKGMAEHAAKSEIRQKQTEHDAVVKILEARVQQQHQEIEAMRSRLENAESRVEEATAKAQAIAIAAMDKDSGKMALDELRTVSHKQAEAKR